jgi:hypothetical protein
MPPSSNALLSLTFIFLLCIPSVSAFTRFRSFFPRFAAGFNAIIDNDCSAEYEAYRNGSTVPLNATMNIWDPDKKAWPVIHCMLEATPEIIKADMASAQVLLGLMPTILAVLGSSLQETAMLFVLGKRPLLALCLSVGSPAVYFDRTFHYRQQIESLERAKDWAPSLNAFLKGNFGITLIEYVLALAAIANIGYLSYELTDKVSFSFAQNTGYLPVIWAFVGAVIHLLGALALWLRTSVTQAGGGGSEAPYSSIFENIRAQFTPLQSEGPICIELRPPNIGYLILSWFTTILAACHVLFGTLLFSAILFVSVGDAVVLIFRYMASIVACKVVINYELAVLRATIKNVTNYDISLEPLGSNRNPNNKAQEARW